MWATKCHNLLITHINASVVKIAKNSEMEVMQIFLEKSHIFYQHDRLLINPNKPSVVCIYGNE